MKESRSLKINDLHNLQTEICLQVWCFCCCFVSFVTLQIANYIQKQNACVSNLGYFGLLSSCMLRVISVSFILSLEYVSILDVLSKIVVI